MKVTQNWLAVGAGLALAATSITLHSWIGVVSLFTLAALWFGKTWLDRVTPAHKPEPSAAELQAQLNALREELKQELDNVRGKLEIRQARFGARE